MASIPIMDLVSRDSHVLGVNRGAQVTGVACASLALPWIAGVLRIYVRTRIQKFFGSEDWLTVASMTIHTALITLLLRSLHFGLGAHIYNISPDYLDIVAKYIFASELLYVITMAITKVAIGVYFLRLASKRYQFCIIYSVMAMALSVSSAYFIFVLLQCQPISYFWNMFGDATGTCLSTSTRANVTYAHAAMSAVTDWAYGILPITFVWKVKMNPRTKLSVVLILSLGFFASTATLVRIYYINKLNQTTDYTWEGINLVKWSIVEPAIALTAASFATLRPLFSSRSQNQASSLYSNSSNRGKDSQETLRNSEDECSQQFAAMLGLSERYGVRTYVYADKKIVPKEDVETQRLQAAWKNEELDESIEASVLHGASQAGGGSRSTGETSPTENSAAIDWASGCKTTVITQTSE
ncbi:8a9ae0a6-52cf-4c0d-a118-9221d71ff85e [Sclerotinia trifoliorum]|uniref:8a9ae0a6-52cf-4c0d-a118-9221d71ff85e n=1 Tax=Sclerotinia trifoliorum TaxID=28548 RepID=A0A8H2W141_9HELO|nr:8a9ae0a6-52cf-4c0d-a118-9221d71ff85e [Sclerotinia trifoliorum]